MKTPVLSLVFNQLILSMRPSPKAELPVSWGFSTVPLPEVLYVEYPDDSPTAKAGVRQSFALFNWTDEPRIVSVLRSRLGHDGPVAVENAWTGERETLDGEFFGRRLDGRSAELYDVRSNA